MIERTQLKFVFFLLTFFSLPFCVPAQTKYIITGKIEGIPVDSGTVYLFFDADYEHARSRPVPLKNGKFRFEGTAAMPALARIHFSVNKNAVIQNFYLEKPRLKIDWQADTIFVKGSAAETQKRAFEGWARKLLASADPDQQPVFYHKLREFVEANSNHKVSLYLLSDAHPLTIPEIIELYEMVDPALDNTFEAASVKELVQMKHMQAGGRQMKRADTWGLYGEQYKNQKQYEAIRSTDSTILVKNMSEIANPEMEGRGTPSLGLNKAADYIHAQFVTAGLQPAKGQTYRQWYVPSSKAGSDARADQASNIIGLVEGTERKDEYVVFLAHYDHEGIKDGKVYPGADDNGSGTVALMELARSFAKAAVEGDRPKRSVAFIAFSGEEQGLGGSGYFADNPYFPLERVSAVINLDMVGRVGGKYVGDKDSLNYVFVLGEDRLSSELKPLVDSANRLVGLNLDRSYRNTFAQSDQYSFAKKGVPAIFLYNGTHPDFHKPTDTPDKIRYGLLQRRIRLAYLTGLYIANRESLLKRDLPLEPDKASRHAAPVTKEGI